MAKKRINIPSDQAAKVLHQSDHTCCICTEPGLAVQIHHIDNDPSNNEISNLAVLCLQCHNKTQVKGGFGRHFGADVVGEHQRGWLSRVQSRRNRADEMAVLRTAGALENRGEPTDANQSIDADSRPAEVNSLRHLAHRLPGALREAMATAQPELDSGTTSRQLQATYEVIALLRRVLVQLGKEFPKTHFGDETPEEYVGRYVAERFQWRRSLTEPNGLGTGGTMAGPLAAMDVLWDLEDAIEDLVSALLYEDERFDVQRWRSEWQSSGVRPSRR